MKGQRQELNSSTCSPVSRPWGKQPLGVPHPLLSSHLEGGTEGQVHLYPWGRGHTHCHPQVCWTVPGVWGKGLSLVPSCVHFWYCNPPTGLGILQKWVELISPEPSGSGGVAIPRWSRTLPHSTPAQPSPAQPGPASTGKRSGGTLSTNLGQNLKAH